jgi:hypothetical protein
MREVTGMSALHLNDACWRKSTFSGNSGDCIEVADGFAGVMPVRDSKDPQGATLVFSADAWSAFVVAVKIGDFPNVK